jgi:soluble lytic murein transglycosylase
LRTGSVASKWLQGVAVILVGAFGLATAASANSAAVDYFRTRADRTAVPTLLTQEERDYYKSLFTAIEHKDWSQVQALFAQKTDGPLHQEALAQFYISADSPKVGADKLSVWLAGGAQLPQAEQIARLAIKRGITELPALPGEQALM